MHFLESMKFSLLTRSNPVATLVAILSIASAVTLLFRSGLGSTLYLPRQSPHVSTNVTEGIAHTLNSTGLALPSLTPTLPQKAYDVADHSVDTAQHALHTVDTAIQTGDRVIQFGSQLVDQVLPPSTNSDDLSKSPIR